MAAPNSNGLQRLLVPLLDSQLMEVILRIILLVFFIITEELEPFQRVIQPGEWWLYNYPHTRSYVPTPMLFFLVSIVPTSTIILVCALRRDIRDIKHAVLAFTLGVLLCLAVTNSVKLTVGRPRPDFLSRCYPKGIPEKPTIHLACTGDPHYVNQGRKSFPSGHSSFTFSSFGFVALYLAGKLHCFEGTHRGHSWRLLTPFFPLFFALLVAISRTMDYHHHWQDVLVGSTLGMFCACIGYYQYYPPLSHPECDKPLRPRSHRLARSMSDSRLVKTGRTWDVEHSAVELAEVSEVKEM